MSFRGGGRGGGGRGGGGRGGKSLYYNFIYHIY